MENNLVVQHNNLVNARYKLSLNEKRILLCAISKINPKKKIESDLIVQLNIKDIINIFDCNKENYTYFIDLARNLRKKDFPINRLKDGKRITVGWFSRATVDTAGVLEIKIDEAIVPYLIELQEYTKYKLENVVKFKNVHTFRIYELCKQYQNIKKRVISLEELKQILQLENKYKRTIDFKRYVLDIAKNEINLHTDININYELTKEGRSYKNIEFTMESKKNIAIKEVNKEKEIYIDPEQKLKIDTLKSMFPEKITESDIKSVLHIAQWDLPKVIEKYYLIKDKANIINFVGLMIKSIKENYDEVAITREEKPYTKTKFHNFDQRTSNYTPEELEKILLEKQNKKFK